MKINRLTGIPMFFFLMLLVASVFSFAGAASSYESRRDIPEKYRWKLEDIFPATADWQTERTALAGQISGLVVYKGKLGVSASSLTDGLESLFSVRQRLDRLSVYAGMLSDQDTREPVPMAMTQAVERLWTDFGAATSYIEPEVLALTNDQIEKFFAAEPKLKSYRVYIDRIRIMKPHYLSDSEEQLLAQAGLVTGIAGGVFNLLSNADLPYPRVRFSNGNEVLMNVSGYERSRAFPVRSDRIKAYQAFYNTLASFRRTCGSLLYGRLKENVFYRNVRRFDSSLQMALSPEEMPTEVYTALIAGVHKYLPYLHRYLNIRKRMLGLDELHYHDFYPELIPGADTRYSYEEGQELIRGALKPLGSEYQASLEQAFAGRWIDVFPTPGKASGAYCNYVYGLHPYIKVNFNGRFADVDMLAHELGHAVHSCISQREQPYVTFDPASFPAEVASNTNEALLKRHLLAEPLDVKQRLALMGNILESFRQTIFRQTLFAEYYYEINRMVERGDVLTGDDFTRIYLDLLRIYYGHPQTAVIDDLYGNEWAYIAHFYYGYSHYQYSIAFAAAEAIAEDLSHPNADMAGKYLRMLAAGGSIDPISLLRRVGVDMTTSAPMDGAMRNMARIMDEMERLLDEPALKK